MSSPSSQSDICLDKEYFGIPPPQNANLPTVDEILDLCPWERPLGSVVLPSESPIFWIKQGTGVYWNEVVAQDTAYHQLKKLQSPVRVPAVYYAFRYDYRIYFVMEYIEGNTVGKCLEQAKTQSEKEHIMNQVVLSLNELYRIPIPRNLAQPLLMEGTFGIRFLTLDEHQGTTRTLTNWRIISMR